MRVFNVVTLAFCHYKLYTTTLDHTDALAKKDNSNSIGLDVMNLQQTRILR